MFLGNLLGCVRKTIENCVAKLVLFAALLGVSMVGFGQSLELVSVPIPVEIDGEPTHCSLYLKLEMRPYDVPIDKFSVGQLDQAQMMFATAAKAIRDGDAAKFGSIWAAPNQMKTTGEATVALADNSPGSWLKLIRSMFDFNQLRVIAEVMVGSQPMFIWDATFKNVTQRRAFYVGLDKDNRLRLSVVSSATPVHELVLEAFEAARTNPESYKPLANINLRYQYPIPIEGAGNVGSHPVFFEFDGSPADFSVLDEKVKAPTPLLEFFRSASLAYARGKNDVFASDFTPKSQQKVGQFFAAIQSNREKENQKQQSVAPEISAGALSITHGYVKFVLNAEPLFLVFQAPMPGNKWPPRELTYTYVVRQGGSYKLTNFGFSNSLDDFLQDSKLFDKRILKPASQKTGGKPANTPAKTTAVKH